MSDATATPFHAGELELQQRAGWREKLAHGAGRFIRDHMPDPHREFFAHQPFIAVGALDELARPWAGVLTGAPGFIQAPDERHLEIGASPAPSDPLASQLRAGKRIGLLGIEFHTRRRNRANGVIETVMDGGFGLRVEQSFGNCKQYIASRTLEYAPVTRASPGAHESPVLSARALDLIRASTTLFIASAARADADARDGREGCDVSHRGGQPGFVGVERASGGNRLWIPDYRGNNFFNTFGNVLRHPYAGLAFPDFVTGDLLMLTGNARVVWEESGRGLVFAPLEGRWQPLGLRLKADTDPH